MAELIHYEVYIFQRNKWDLLARYPEEQRMEAVDYAKKIEKNDHFPTKVMRETYDLNTRTFHETLIFLSEKQNKTSQKNYLYPNTHIPELSSSSTEAKGGGSVVEALTMLLLSLLFAVIVSGISTATLLHAAFSFGWLSHNIPQESILMIFVFFFFLIAIPTAAKWVDWNVFLQDSSSDKTSETPSANHSSYQFSNPDIYGSDTMTESAPPSFLSYIMLKLFDFFDLLLGRESLSERLQKENQKEDEENVVERTENEEQEAPEETSQEEEEKKEDQKTDSTPANKEIEIPHSLETSYLKMTSFLTIVLRALKRNSTYLNTYTRFGLELFLAGACESMCQEASLSKEENKILLTKLLTVLGRTPSLAEVFYLKMDEYTLEPKYLPMIEHGAECMRLFSSNSSSPELITLTQSYMEEWKNPDQKEQISSGIITVMFTDMVSSTHLTQTMGDNFAQQIVRVHNSIVRKALKKYGGTEIKHTGDGIMASFVWASNAIDAAVEIQQAVAKRNNEEPTVPLEVRIGLNSGEPIVEDNDLFGSTVQMASRVCGLAGANQIYVSSVVKNLSAGKKHSFKSLGDFTLKGIDEPQPLYEVLWERPANTTAANKDNEYADFSTALPEF